MQRKSSPSQQMVDAAKAGQSSAPGPFSAPYAGWERHVALRAWKTPSGKIVSDLNLVKMGVR